MTFAEILVAQLGTKQEALGVGDGVLILGALGLLVGIELLLGRAVSKAVAWAWRRGRAGLSSRQGRNVR